MKKEFSTKHREELQIAFLLSCAGVVVWGCFFNESKILNIPLTNRPPVPAIVCASVVTGVPGWRLAKEAGARPDQFPGHIPHVI